MSIMRPTTLVAVSLLLLAISRMAATTAPTSLDGEWRFALDPLAVGETEGWYQARVTNESCDRVMVPHCFTVDPRYHEYTGTAWYFRTFSRPVGAGTAGDRVFVHFEAAFQAAKVWLNGQLLGSHEGGYTPFELDATDAIAPENLLVVEVNNAWSTTTLPGAKTPVTYEPPNFRQTYPWMNYGGLTRSVTLLVRPTVYIEHTRIDAVPNLADGTAHVSVAAYVRNAGAHAWTANHLEVALSCGGRRIAAHASVSSQPVSPGAQTIERFEVELAAADVRLWSLDAPILYHAQVLVGDDRADIDFGIRRVEVHGTQLLLNGEPTALGGCNRPADSPGYGSIDPPEVLDRDLRMIKAGGMELSRIIHYPVDPRLLDWADHHGLLIIAEAGNWQLTPAQMADPTMRSKFRQQMREMVERDWNHPSIVAWSVGNEFQSQTPEGREWVRDMFEFVRSLDNTRLLTFADMMFSRLERLRPEDEASQYCDFVSANIYGEPLPVLQKIHGLYPDKPVYVSEFGKRLDLVASEDERVAYLERAVSDFRQCARFLIGASVWTFNDYESMYPGSAANGYRPWGLVGPDRRPRAMYEAFREGFCPAVLTVGATNPRQIEVTVTARSDFPRRTLRHFRLRAGRQMFEIERLEPGQQRTFVLPRDAATDLASLEDADGLTVLEVRLGAAGTTLPPPARTK